MAQKKNAVEKARARAAKGARFSSRNAVSAMTAKVNGAWLSCG
jgi:hypothetical protein